MQHSIKSLNQADEPETVILKCPYNSHHQISVMPPISKMLNHDHSLTQ